eukprot:Plantae.Rhodophyta-Rhodochaete_pulchella.ctg40993.p1 GENE.Plantae.Rhodophyta-Rhodochaete_pulchella.ctg40993~~Plantae.Rhodophyta-Rhodochaete_pulchella.ctg40993.p1  ORF type:complete len:174 (+),score=13.66 Plantae.Rhodophyta-Rhodochaete_pulchella.ctg40993:44-523(+)
MSTAQLQWLEKDLANHSSADWRIVAGHRPFYCSNPGNKIQCTTYAAYLRSLAEDILYNNSVDLAIQCHEHDMERSWPTYKGEPVAHNYSDPSAPVYVVNGAGGNREGNSCGSGCGTPSWSAWTTQDRGYGLVTVSGPKQLEYAFVATNGTVLDSLTITR